MILRLLNKLGFFRIFQLKVGGMCGCCGRSMPTHIWVDTGDNWDDIGICSRCLRR